jgi:hypothetical protein
MEPGSGSRIFIKTKSEFESLIANEVNKDEWKWYKTCKTCRRNC